MVGSTSVSVNVSDGQALECTPGRTDAVRVRSRSRGTALERAIFLLVLAAVSCASNDPLESSTPEDGVIVFTAGDTLQGPSSELYSINEDGSGLRQLTDDGTVKTALTQSPDGARLAYAAFGNELTEESSLPELSSIYVIDAKGNYRRVLCERCSRTAYAHRWEPTDIPYHPSVESVPNSLAWSPNGSSVAAPAASPGVLLIDTGTGEASTIPTPEPITAIAWSPDGRTLAVSHTWFQPEVMVPREGTELSDEREGRSGGIYLVEVGTGDVEEVISTPGMAHVHGWSPDGDLIAYTAHAGTYEGNEVSMYSVSQDTTWRIVPGKRWQWGLGGSWSPTGDRIAALVEQGGEDIRTAKDLFIASSDGMDLRALPFCQVKGAFDGEHCMRGTMVWSPDGMFLAYRAFIRGTPIVSALILEDVDDSSTEVVRLDGPTFYTTWVDDEACCLAWLPAAA
jgi:Tol biopolymer transport system component